MEEGRRQEEGNGACYLFVGGPQKGSAHMHKSKEQAAGPPGYPIPILTVQQWKSTKCPMVMVIRSYEGVSCT